MSKFEVDLPPELSDFLQRQVDAGLHKTVADVIEDAVRRSWEDDDGQLEALRAALAPGLADIEAGRVLELTIEEILADARGGARAPE